LVPLAEGQRIILDERQDLLESVQRVAPDVIEKHLAWRDGMLMFDNDPLDTVIAEINRYTTVRIQITDSSIRDLRFGGYFRIGDVPLILATMEENYGLKVDRITDNLVYLSRKPAHD
jgi:transmembrane sensor